MSKRNNSLHDLDSGLKNIFSRGRNSQLQRPQMANRGNQYSNISHETLRSGLNNIFGEQSRQQMQSQRPFAPKTFSPSRMPFIPYERRSLGDAYPHPFTRERSSQTMREDIPPLLRPDDSSQVPTRILEQIRLHTELLNRRLANMSPEEFESEKELMKQKSKRMTDILKSKGYRKTGPNKWEKVVPQRQASPQRTVLTHSMSSPDFSRHTYLPIEHSVQQPMHRTQSSRILSPHGRQFLDEYNENVSDLSSQTMREDILPLVRPDISSQIPAHILEQIGLHTELLNRRFANMSTEEVESEKELMKHKSERMRQILKSKGYRKTGPNKWEKVIPQTQRRTSPLSAVLSHSMSLPDVSDLSTEPLEQKPMHRILSSYTFTPHERQIMQEYNEENPEYNALMNQMMKRQPIRRNQMEMNRIRALKQRNQNRIRREAQR